MPDQTSYDREPRLFTSPWQKSRAMLNALHVLTQLGWNYLTSEQVDRLRGGRTHSVILTQLLTEHMRTHCRFVFKGHDHPFTENAIQAAVQLLKGVRTNGTIQQEYVYDLLCLGTSVPQTIEGDIKSFSINYIDWQDPARNTYHVTTGFKVTGSGYPISPYPDIVLFINGIPLVVIACQSSTRSSDEKMQGDPANDLESALEQLKVCQGRQGIPRLFLFAQLLIAVSQDKALYGTSGTARHFWSAWKEECIDGPLRQLLDLPVHEKAMDPLLFSSSADLQGAYSPRRLQGRAIREPDRLVYALCRPERLLELIFRFVLFDGKSKKIARCHQFFTIQEVLKRVINTRQGQPGPGGVVWHTPGSGKSLTMVMLAKSLALDPAFVNPKIVLVTDRIDPRDQVCGTFRACGLAPEQAASGKHLVALLCDRRSHIIIALSHKFAIAMDKRSRNRIHPNTVVLVDEDHRSQCAHHHAPMEWANAGACFIAFTGSPPARLVQQGTLAGFGEFFHPPYTSVRAVADKVVTPLLYEARHVPRQVGAKAADTWFMMMTKGMSREKRADLRRRFSTENRLNKALVTVRRIAWDVSVHYSGTFGNTGLKGQLVAPDKETALKYKQFFDEFDLLTSEVLVSSPSVREGDDRSDGPSAKEKRFWQEMMDRFGSEKNYFRQLVSGFKYGEHPEIIIVVDRLLAGFDAPCNAVLYLARKLDGHTLLQAIARVNRLHEAKAYGLILDYSAVIRNLDQPADFYEQLADYDPADISAAITNMTDCTGRLPLLHAGLWKLFHPYDAAGDSAAFECLLRDDNLRDQFYKHFDLFARTLRLALSSSAFLLSASSRTIRHYKADLEFFRNVRAAVTKPCDPSPVSSAYQAAGRPGLGHGRMARKYSDCVSECMPTYRSAHNDPGALIALQISRRLESCKIRDWRSNPDIINKMRAEIDEILFDAAGKYGIDLRLEDQDAIINRCIAAAMADDE